MRWIIVFAIIVAGCKAAERCTPASAACAHGTYELCSDGASCRIVTSDGENYACASCGDCQAATMRAIAWCGPPGGSGGNGGGGNGTGGNGTGGGTQSQACIDYLSCAAVATPSQLPMLIGTYGPSGSCWQSTAALADSCTAACTSALQQIRSQPGAPAVCTGKTMGTSCSDGTKDGDETDVDCGGATCAPCAEGLACAVANDCISGACVNGSCGPGAAIPNAPVYRIAPNASVTLGGLGWAISTSDGSSYRLVWTGAYVQHAFSGSVSTGGSFVSVTPGCSGGCAGADLQVTQEGLDIHTGLTSVIFASHDYLATDEPEGFDFVVQGATPGAPVFFELYVDNAIQPSLVLYTDATTMSSASPAQIPFGLTTE